MPAEVAERADDFADEDEDALKKNLENNYFGCLHKPWERMRQQKSFCRVCRTGFWMSELIFCRALPDLEIF